MTVKKLRTRKGKLAARIALDLAGYAKTKTEQLFLENIAASLATMDKKTAAAFIERQPLLSDWQRDALGLALL